MIKRKKYVFDLDNTLIYTDDLNNLAYNNALQLCDLSEINDKKRVTKNTILEYYPNISKDKYRKIIETKKRFFASNLEKTIGNSRVLDVLRAQSPENSILWTSAEKDRTELLLKFYGIDKCFGKLYFSEKSNIKNDLDEMCKFFKCEREELIIYEDNLIVISELSKLSVSFEKINAKIS